MIFLSYMPRSGSTLLASLLNQRPDTYASPTSNLCNTMGEVIKAWVKLHETKASSGKDKALIRMLAAMMGARYDTDY